jgi:hypothetical protein
VLGRFSNANSTTSMCALPWTGVLGDGLATRLGDRVGVSRSAVRFDALEP